MSTLIASQSATDDSELDSVPETLADLVHRLGEIPLERIRMRPPLGTATEDDIISMRMCELIDGVVVEKAMSFFESQLAAELIVYLGIFLRTHRLGFVVGADAQMRMVTGRIRMPDVSYFSWQRTGGKVSRDPIGPCAPDLAVEVLSAGNTKQEMLEKRQDLFGAGTRLMWILDPQTKTVAVYHGVDECQLVEADGTLNGEDVLPGFSLSIEEWFKTASGDAPVMGS